MRTEHGLFLPALLAVWGLFVAQILFRSLWIDESVTFWIAQGPLGEVLRRGGLYQPHSPLHFLVEHFTMLLFGRSEVALRAPSFLAGILSVCIVFRLARRFLDPPVPAFAALFLLFTPDLVAISTSARPYALALFCALVSISALIDFLERGRGVRLVVFTISACAAIHLHFLFALVIAVHLAIVAASHPLAPRRFGRFLAAEGVVAVSLVPVLFRLVHHGESAALEFGSIGLGTLVRSFLDAPLLVAIALACGYNIRSLSMSRLRALVSDRRLLALLSWWILPAFFLWGAGELLHRPIFQSRYATLSLPAYALLVAALVGTCIGRAAYPVLLFAVISVQTVGLYVHSGIAREDWRGVADYVNAAGSDGHEIPVLVHSALLEAADPGWISSPERVSYLLAPFSRYPVVQPLVALPWSVETSAGRRYLEGAVRPAIQDASEVIVVTRGQGRARAMEETERAVLGGAFRRVEERSFDALALRYYERDPSFTSSRQ